MIPLGILAASASSAFSPASLSPFLWLTANPLYCFTDAGGTVAAGDGDAVRIWKDRSGNAHDLSQATAGSRPILHLDGGDGGYHLTFDGSDDSMAATWTLLAQPNTVAARTDGPRCWESDTSPTNRQILTLESGLSGMYALGGIIAGSTAYSAGVMRTVTGIYDGASSKFRVNGVQEATGDAGSAGTESLSMAFDGTTHFPLQIRHLVVAASALSGADLTNLETWLGSATN